MNSTKFIDVLRAADLEPRSYSGRGMYGRECVGVELGRGESAFNLSAQMLLQQESLVQKRELRLGLPFPGSISRQVMESKSLSFLSADLLKVRM